MRTVGQRDGGRRPRDFFHRNHMRQVRHTCPAKLFRNSDAQQTQVTKLFPELIGKLVFQIDVRCHWLDALLRKAMHHLAQCVDVFTQIKIHRVHEHGASPPVIEQLFNN